MSDKVMSHYVFYIYPLGSASHYKKLVNEVEALNKNWLLHNIPVVSNLIINSNCQRVKITIRRIGF